MASIGIPCSRHVQLWLTLGSLVDFGHGVRVVKLENIDEGIVDEIAFVHLEDVRICAAVGEVLAQIHVEALLSHLILALHGMVLKLNGVN